MTLISCFLSSFGKFRPEVSEKKSKHLSQSETGKPYCFSDWTKNTSVIDDVEVLLPVKFRQLPLSGFKEEVENVPVSHCWVAIVFLRFDRKTHTLLVILSSCFLLSFDIFRLAVLAKKSKMSQSFKSQGSHLVFPIGPYNTNVIEDAKQKQKYRGMFENQKSRSKTSSGDIGLNIRTLASPKVGQDQV